MKKLLCILGLLGVITAPSLALDPASLDIKVYKFAASTSEYCTDPVTVFTDSSPDYQNMLDNPEFGSGSLDDGTYECVIIEMSDRIKFTPDGSSGSCTDGETITMDVCRERDGEESETAMLVDGTEVTCDNSENRVAIFLSTATIEPESEEEDGPNAFYPPTSSENNGIELLNSLVVAGTSSGVLSIDTDDTLDGTEAECEMNKPTFSFSTD